MSIKAIRQTTLFDEDTGEIQSQWSTIGKYKSELGDDWIVFYKKSLVRLVQEVPKLSIMKVYMRLCAYQTFQSQVMVSMNHVAKELDMTYKTVWHAFQWLLKYNYIKKVNVEGLTGWVINPNVSTCGRKAAKEKQKLWQSLPNNMHDEFKDDPLVVLPGEENLAELKNFPTPKNSKKPSKNYSSK